MTNSDYQEQTEMAGGFTLRLGYHSVDQSYTEAWIDWGGLNISIATTVDTTDTGLLTVVATVVSSGTSDSNNNGNASGASDIALLLIPSFANGRAGVVAAGGGKITGVGAGLRTSTLTAIQGGAFLLPTTPVNASVPLPSLYIGMDLRSSTPVVVSSDAEATAAAIIAKTADYRAKEAARLSKYGPDWSDVKDAVQTSLMWSVMYDPKLSMLAPSYAYAPGSEESPNPTDGDLWAGQFEWDQSFAAYMLGIDALGLALSQVIALLKMKTAAGMVPGFSSGLFKLRGFSQPPITGKALYEIAKRWGVNQTKWALELCFDDLYEWNTVLFTQRREAPLGLLSYGCSKYNAYANDGTSMASHPSCGGGESGLDNGPTVENVPFNLTGLDVQDQYEAGYTGMYLMDTKAQLGIAEMLGRKGAADELRRRFSVVNKAMLATLWNESEGVFQNCLSTPLKPITRLAPTHFYPLLAGPEQGPSEAQVVTTVRRALTNNSKMAVWPSGIPPIDLPPVYARPLVQWYSTICDHRGGGCTDGPHALCAQLDCNFNYAYGNFVQRAHAKVRYEGMALSRVDASTASIGGVAPVALYDFNCSSSQSNATDFTVAPHGWRPGHGDGPCVLRYGVNTKPAMYVLPSRAGPAAASLVELTMWYRPGDHYVVASADGTADAKAKGYTQLSSLGFVWPPPASANASSRYGLPSLSKDDEYYISQDYWRGRIWSPMLQLVYWGIEQYASKEAKGAADGLVAQSKALLLREWYGYDSDNTYTGTGHRVMENYGADTAEGFSYASSAAPMYAWGALSGHIGLVHNGFYDPLPADIANTKGNIKSAASMRL
jgi:hypothetical protein